MRRSGAAKNAGALGRRGAGRVDVIHQQDVAIRNSRRVSDGERAAQILTALMATESDLASGIAQADQRATA